MEPQISLPDYFDCDYEFDPITIHNVIMKHPQIKTYCENLSRNEMIQLLSSLYPPDEIEGQIKELQKTTTGKREFSMMLNYVLSRHLNEGKDEIIISWCKETLNKIKNGYYKDIRSLDTLKDYEPVYIEDVNVSLEDLLKTKDYKFIPKDRLGEFCYYQLCANGSYINAFRPTREPARYSLLRVIQTKMKIKKVIDEMDKFLRYNTFDTEKKTIYELCKKFNLNLRIHTWDTKNLKEKLMREDNDGWFMPQSEGAVCFEVGKYGNHFFPYYFIDINPEILKDPFKLIAFFQFEEFNGFEKFLTHSDNQKLSTMKLVVNLIKLGILTKHDTGKNSKILRYRPSKYFHENGEIKESVLYRIKQAAIEMGLFDLKPLTD